MQCVLQLVKVLYLQAYEFRMEDKSICEIPTLVSALGVWLLEDFVSMRGRADLI